MQNLSCDNSHSNISMNVTMYTQTYLFKFFKFYFWPEIRKLENESRAVQTFSYINTVYFEFN